jgi:hypothetical protein
MGENHGNCYYLSSTLTSNEIKQPSGCIYASCSACFAHNQLNFLHFEYERDIYWIHKTLNFNSFIPSINDFLCEKGMNI